MGGAPSNILPGLWLGGCDILEQPHWFQENNITHTVSICHVAPGDAIPLQGKMHINLPDVPTTNLRPYMEDVVTFIHKARVAGGQVYVHCAAGISRSTTMTCAYIMAACSLPLRTTLQYVTLRRSCVCPNQGFRQQLNQWEQETQLFASKLKSSVPGDEVLVQKDLQQIQSQMESGASGVAAMTDEQQNRLQEDQVREMLRPLQNQGRTAGGDIGLAWLQDGANNV
mmetsp:Transcript_17494/g.25537  ORF Transcript_17494/g.25537 Transcript_17494/m.25537 type:complete len:226 (-) Transcript_17494:316-993(-)